MSFLDPKAIVMQMPILEGDLILDLGCGSGAYSFEIAKIYRKVKVYAIDKNRDMLDSIVHSAVMQSVTQIETLEIDLEHRWPIESVSADHALIINVLHACKDKVSVLSELRRVMKPHSYIVVIDWSDDTTFGPGPYAIKKDDMVQILTNAGFRIKSDIPAGHHHYGMIIENI